MRGLVGLFKLDGAPVTPGDLQRLGVAPRRPASDRGGDGTWISSSMGLGCLGPWTTPAAGANERDLQPFVARSGVVVSIDGRLDDSPSSTGDAAYVAAAYERSGETFASELNGDFALALFDPAAQTLVLARDVMGARRLHYTQAGRTLFFATDIKSLLACPGVTRAPDEEGLADLVLDRWVDPHHTCFREIFSVPPGHLLMARPDAIAVREHWAFDPTREIQFRNVDDYQEAFRELFERSVQRRLRGHQRVAVTVSGGLDSSSVFCQAAALARRQSGTPALHGISMTFPSGSPADEQVFLRSIETSTGMSIERIPIDELRILADGEADVDQLEMPDLVWDAHRAIYQRAKAAGCSVILDGYYGDQALFPRHYLVDLAWHGRWWHVRRDLREFGAGVEGATGAFAHDFREMLTRSLLPGPIFQAVKRRAARQRTGRYPVWYTKAFIERVLERQMTRFGPAHRFATWHAEGCVRDATAGHYLLHFERQSRTAAAEGVDLASPFRDRDLLAFLMAIPGSVVNAGGVPKGLMRQAMKAILPQPIRDRRSKADFTALLNRAALRDYDVVRQLLTKDCMAVAEGFVDGNVIEETVRAFKDRIASDETSAIAAWRVTELAALELWLRHFLGSGAVEMASRA